MSHINYTRTIRCAGPLSLHNIFPPQNWGASFAAFCGSPEQRRAAVLQGIRRCCGNMGVVVLQNDPLLASALGRLRASSPDLATICPNFHTYSINPVGQAQTYYDPLYGMTCTDVIDAILPPDQPNRDVLSAGLNAYLRLMQRQFHLDPVPFGHYPFNLDLLAELTNMPLSQLKNQVLYDLPQTEQHSIYSVLSRNDLCLSVRAAVDAFARDLNGRLWTPRGFAGHTGMSMVEAVRRRCLISISVPVPQPRILAYLYQELNTLIRQRTPFLLAVSEVPLTASPDLCQLFTAPHGTASYATGLAASDLSHVLRDPADLGPLLAEHEEVLLFRCNSTQQAEPFSAAMGTYQRITEEEHQEKNRQPLALFSAHGIGQSQREVTERNINAQELMHLGSGGVLCGSLYLPPIMIQSVIL